MHIENLPSGGRIRTLSLSEMSKRERDTLQSFEHDTAHNVYLTPSVVQLLAQKGRAIPTINYGLAGNRTVFYAAKAPASDKGLLNREGKLVLDFLDISTGSTAGPIWREHAPSLAGVMPELNIVVGVIGCYDKLSRTGLQKRIGGGLCLADMAVKTLLLLGQFIPGLQHMANYLMFVQIGIKAGDKYVEYRFSGKEKAGQEVLKAVEVSVSSSEIILLPLNSIGTLSATASTTSTSRR
jgi:hypothetical protein